MGLDDIAFDPNITRRWLPVDSYIGGNEHAVLHLMYARFITMALHDIGLLDFEEPFTRFRAHGIIVKDGRKMSKTRGNVVTPDPVIEEFGADTFRLYLMFLGPFTEGGDYRDDGIRGPLGFLRRLWDAVLRAADNDAGPDPRLEGQLHRTIEQVTRQIADLQYNTCISGMMEYLNAVRAGGRTPARAEIEPIVLMVAPFAPAHRRGALGTARPRGRRLRTRPLARIRPREGQAAHRKACRAGERQGARHHRGTFGDEPGGCGGARAPAGERRALSPERVRATGDLRAGAADQPGGRVRLVLRYAAPASGARFSPVLAATRAVTAAPPRRARHPRALGTSCAASTYRGRGTYDYINYVFYVFYVFRAAAEVGPKAIRVASPGRPASPTRACVSDVRRARPALRRVSLTRSRTLRKG